MTEDQFLQKWSRTADRHGDIPVPSKRQVRNFVERRKGHRLVSERMLRVTRQQTSDQFKACYQDADKAGAGHRGLGGDESIMTRNVGPSDLGPNYCHGKPTIARSTL